MNALKFQLLSGLAREPIYASDGAVGIDLFVSRGQRVFRGEYALIDHDVAVEIPEGYYGQLCLRSSAVKHGVCIPIGLGVIDPDYRGGLRGVLVALDRDVDIHVGDRLFQLLIVPCVRPALLQVDALSSSNRGGRGFGSTGL